jgi:drug/metabolite transporter (DMT)-like permease
LVLTVQFIAFVAAMRFAPVTVVVPLMACTYILTTVLAHAVLKEKVTGMRWAGVGVIVAGVALIGTSTLGTPQSRPTERGPMRRLGNVVHAVNKTLSFNGRHKHYRTRLPGAPASKHSG